MKFRYSFAAAALPFLLLLGMIARYGVDVPFEDELAFAPMMDAIFRDHAFDRNLLFVQANEHRPFFPLVLITLLASLTDWNLKTELLLSPLFSLLSLFFLFKIGEKTLKDHDAKERGALLFAASVLIFSLAQWEIWTMGFALHFVMVNTAFVASVLLLSQKVTWKKILLAALLCLIAGFSATHGLLTFLALLPLLTKSKRDCKQWLTPWFLFCAITLFLFYAGNHIPVREGGALMSALEHPSGLLRFIFLFLGTPLFSWNGPAALVCGIVFCSLLFWLVFFYIKKRTPALLPWISIGLFALLSASAIALGRAGLTGGNAAAMATTIDFADLAFSHALKSRYAVIASLLPVSLLFGWRSIDRKHSLIFYVLVSVLIFFGIIASTLSLDSWNNRSKILTEGRECFLRYEEASSQCLGTLYFGKGEEARNFAAMLDRIGF